MTNPWDGLVARFDSFSEFVDFAEHAPSVLPTRDQASRERSAYRSEFSGVSSFEEAARLARKGWPEGLAKVEKIRVPLVNKILPVVIRPDMQYDVVGNGGIDMGRVMAGLPDPFMEWDDSGVPVYGAGNQIIRIVVNIGASCHTSQDAIIARGAAVAALVDALEVAGRRVSVVIAQPTTDPAKTEKTKIFVILKRPSDPLSLDTLTFALAHPATLRRLMFAVEERHPDEAVIHKFRFHQGGTYGFVTDLDEGETGDIYIGAIRGDAHPTTIQKWVLNSLKQQGVEIEENQL